MREEIKPQIMLCGHLHQTSVNYPGEPFDDFGQACPVVIGGNPHLQLKKEQGIDRYEGAAIIWEGNRITVRFTDETGAVTGEETFDAS